MKKQQKFSRLAASLAGAALLASIAPSQAAVITSYADAGAWTTGLTPPTTVPQHLPTAAIGFDDLPALTPAPFTLVTPDPNDPLNPLKFFQATFGGTGTSVFTTGPNNPYPGNSVLAAFGDAGNPPLSTSITISFLDRDNNPFGTRGVAFEFGVSSLVAADGITVSVNNAAGDSVEVTGAALFPTFFGLTSDTVFTSVTVTARAPVGGLFTGFLDMDNVSFGVPTQPVPVGSSLLLLLPALSALGFVRRRRH